MLMQVRSAVLAGAKKWEPVAGLGALLLGFWDADRPATLSLSGSNVTTWTDIIGGYQLTQAVSASKPTYAATGLNGRGVVTGDGTDDYLGLESVPFPTSSNGCEIWMLVDQQSLVGDATERAIMSYGGTAGGTVRSVRRTVAGGANRARATDASTNIDMPSGDFSGAHVIRGIFTGAAIGIAMDGGAPVSTAKALTTASTPRTRLFTTTSAAPSTFFKGGANAVLITSVLDDARAASLAAFLKARGGIA